MLSRKIVAVAAVVILSGAGSAAYAAELGAESIVHEQSESQRAAAEQAQYLAYHNHFNARSDQSNQSDQSGGNSGVLPHHN